MITYITIHKQLHFMLIIVINQIVNVWQRKIIVWVGFVEIPVIDTNSDLPNFFGDQENIVQPSKVFCHFH